jgi:hypothetical protein
MKKLSLNVDALHVETFELRAPEAAGGTVIAHAPTYPDPNHTCAYHCTWPGE